MSPVTYRHSQTQRTRQAAFLLRRNTRYIYDTEFDTAAQMNDATAACRVHGRIGSRHECDSSGPRAIVASIADAGLRYAEIPFVARPDVHGSGGTLLG